MISRPKTIPALQKVPILKANFRLIKNLDKAFACGQMARLTKANGKVTKWKAKVSLNGRMVAGMQASSKMTPCMAMVPFSGQLAASSWGRGKLERSTDQANSSASRASKRRLITKKV